MSYKIVSDSIESDQMIFDRLKWMTSKEAAVYLRISVGSLRNLVYRKQIRTHYLGNRLRFLRSDLDQLIFSHKGGK